MSVIKAVTSSRPFPLQREAVLSDGLRQSYTRALDSIEPEVFLKAGKHFYNELSDGDATAPITVPIVLADTVDRCKDIGDNNRARIAYCKNPRPAKKDERLHTRLKWTEESGYYETVPRFCRLLWAEFASVVRDLRKARLDVTTVEDLDWGSIRHMGHSLVFPPNWDTPSILLEKDLYSDSAGAMCLGSVLFLPIRKGAPNNFVRIKKNLINLQLPGFVNDNLIVADIFPTIDGRQVFGFLHRGHDSEPRCYLHYVDSLVAGSFDILSEKEYEEEYVAKRSQATGLVADAK